MLSFLGVRQHRIYKKVSRDMNELMSFFLGKKGSYSSKRLGGLSIIFVILVCFVVCVIYNRQMPNVTEFLAGCAVTLLGIDPVTKAIKGNRREDESEV